MTFGEKLQALRRNKGISQDVLAEQLEVSRQAVSKWERDEAMPETDKIVRIAQLFAVSTDYLLTDGTEPTTPPPQPTPRGRRWEAQLRRHGYKGGYILLILGIFACLLSIGGYFLCQGIGHSVTDQTVSSFYDSQIQIEGINGEALSPEVEDAIRQQLMQGGNLTVESVSAFTGFGAFALQALSAFCLLGVIPGGILTGAGIWLLCKGKKRSKQVTI